MEELKIKAEYLFEFSSFQNWVNTARVKFESLETKVRVATICVNTAGDICALGSDFQYSEDNNLFPVKAYQLKRASL